MKDATDAALIADLQLGHIEEVYTLNRSFLNSMIFLGVLSLILVLFSILVFAPQVHYRYPLVLIPFLILTPILAVISSLWLYQFSNMRVYICTRGLLYLQHKKRQPIQWDEVSQAYLYIGSGKGSHSFVRLISQDRCQFDFLPPDQTARLFTTLQAKGAQYHFQVFKK
jgi:hypothetical protein